jgi:hypothetical protein
MSPRPTIVIVASESLTDYPFELGSCKNIAVGNLYLIIFKS